MLTLSEILIKEYKMKSYKELKEFIIKKIDEGEMFLSIDIKPSFDDTPDYWETDLENLFSLLMLSSSVLHTYKISLLVKS